MQTAAPTVSILNKFAAPRASGAGTGELAQNLAIVLQDLDTQDRAVEPDPRSPGGKGFSGLEALLQYVFNQTLAINTFGPFGHMLAVDAFVSPMCTPYATPGTIAANLKQYGAAYRQCYSWLGPNQPGVNETDPTNPSACVPDPGGAPPGETGPSTTAAKCPAEALSTERGERRARRSRARRRRDRRPARARPARHRRRPAEHAERPERARAPSTRPSARVTVAARRSRRSSVPSVPLPAQPQTSTSTPNNGAPSAQQAQQLLNYLLSP